MQKKTLCVIIGLLLTFAMLLFACNPEPTTAPASTTSKPPTQTTTTTTKPPSDKPQYGGTLTLLSGTNFQVFAPGAGRPGGPPFMWEGITRADRTRGPAGSKLVDYGNGPTSMADVIGCLAEKWSTPDSNTWVLDIRQGVHFPMIPNNAGSTLVGGREMTADDIIASLEANRDQAKSWAKTRRTGFALKYDGREDGAVAGDSARTRKPKHCISMADGWRWQPVRLA